MAVQRERASALRRKPVAEPRGGALPTRSAILRFSSALISARATIFGREVDDLALMDALRVLLPPVFETVLLDWEGLSMRSGRVDSFTHCVYIGTVSAEAILSEGAAMHSMRRDLSHADSLQMGQ